MASKDNEKFSKIFLNIFQIFLKTFLTSVKNLCPQLTWKLDEAISSKIWLKSKQIKTNENQWRFWSFYI